ncbi:hypothetical protein [Marivita sp.]|uniref:hypothetical protein n=1 Tax=Marivita sp. TaxID=2003365 RepID=UPI003F6A66C8
MIISLGLYSIAVAGLFLVASKYGLSAAPLAYHTAIIERDGTVSNGTRRVIEALYRVWAGSLAGFAICLLGLIWGAAASGAAWPHGVILVATCVVAIPSIIVPRRVEQETKIKTPWRLVLVLLSAVILGFLAWIIGF